MIIDYSLDVYIYIYICVWEKDLNHICQWFDFAIWIPRYNKIRKLYLDTAELSKIVGPVGQKLTRSRFKLFRVRPDVRSNFSVTWDRQNAWRWPASLLNFASQTCRCLQSPFFVYFWLYNKFWLHIEELLWYTELFYVFLKSLCFYPMEIGVLQLMEEIIWKRKNETIGRWIGFPAFR